MIHKHLHCPQVSPPHVYFTQKELIRHLLRLLDHISSYPVVYTSPRRKLSSMRTSDKLSAIVAAAGWLPLLAQASECEAGGTCMLHCQQKLGYCMTVAGLDNEKIAKCQAAEGECQMKDCGCQQPLLPLRTSVVDHCFTSCRNSLFECNGGRPYISTYQPCGPKWFKCMETCVPGLKELPPIRAVNPDEASTALLALSVHTENDVPCSIDCNQKCESRATTCELEHKKSWMDCANDQLHCNGHCEKSCFEAFRTCRGLSEWDCRACCDRNHDICDPINGDELSESEKRECFDKKVRCYGNCPYTPGPPQVAAMRNSSALAKSVQGRVAAPHDDGKSVLQLSGEIGYKQPDPHHPSEDTMQSKFTAISKREECPWCGICSVHYQNCLYQDWPKIPKEPLCRKNMNFCFSICNQNQSTSKSLPPGVHYEWYDPLKHGDSISWTPRSVESTARASTDLIPDRLKKEPPLQQDAAACQGKCNHENEMCMARKPASVDGLGCWQELLACYEICRPKRRELEIPASSTATSASIESSLVLRSAEDTAQAPDNPPPDMLASPMLCNSWCDDQRTTCYAKEPTGSACHHKTLQCYKKCLDAAYHRAEGESPSFAPLNSRNLGVLGSRSPGHQRRAASDSERFLAKRASSSKTEPDEAEEKYICFDRCQRTKWQCAPRSPTDRSCQIEFEGCLDGCDEDELNPFRWIGDLFDFRVVPEAKIATKGIESGSDISAAVTPTSLTDISPRDDEAACLHRCEAVKNTCDTIVPVRQNCEQRFAICRHSCISNLRRMVPHSTLVTRRSKRSTPASQSPATLPTDKTTCVDQCRVNEVECSRLGGSEEHCLYGRLVCDQSCYQASSTGNGIHRTDIAVLTEREEERDEGCVSRCRSTYGVCLLAARDAMGCSWQRNACIVRCPRKHNTKRSEDQASDISSDETSETFLKEPCKCAAECDITFHHCEQNNSQTRCEKERERCVHKCYRWRTLDKQHTSNATLSPRAESTEPPISPLSCLPDCEARFKQCCENNALSICSHERKMCRTKCAKCCTKDERGTCVNTTATDCPCHPRLEARAARPSRILWVPTTEEVDHHEGSPYIDQTAPGVAKAWVPITFFTEENWVSC